MALLRQWQNREARWNEVERTEMDVGIGAKQTGALIRAVASRYRDHRSATLRDNDNKLHASLASSEQESRSFVSSLVAYLRQPTTYCLSAIFGQYV